MQLIKEGNILRGDNHVETILLRMPVPLNNIDNSLTIDFKTRSEQQIKWVKVSNEMTSAGVFIYNVLDEIGNTVIDNTRTEINCFYNTKGSSIGIPMSPSLWNSNKFFLQKHQYNAIEIKAQAGEEILDYSYFVTEIISDSSMSIDATDSDPALERYYAEIPGYTFEVSENGMFQEALQSATNQFGYYATGCFKLALPVTKMMAL